MRCQLSIFHLPLSPLIFSFCKSFVFCLLTLKSFSKLLCFRVNVHIVHKCIHVYCITSAYIPNLSILIQCAFVCACEWSLPSGFPFGAYLSSSDAHRFPNWCSVFCQPYLSLSFFFCHGVFTLSLLIFQAAPLLSLPSSLVARSLNCFVGHVSFDLHISFSTFSVYQFHSS